MNEIRMVAPPGRLGPVDLRAGTPEGVAERRFLTGDVEVRAKDDDGSWVGGGLAIVYGARSGNLGGFVEVVKPGAARNVLALDPDVRALLNHDANLVLGRTTAGTLRLADTDAGLDYEYDAPATSYARDLRVLLERGDVTQSSFAFRVRPEGVEWTEDEESGLPVRIIHEFSGLYDVSPVTFPAYPDATSGLRETERPARETEPEPALTREALALRLRLRSRA